MKTAILAVLASSILAVPASAIEPIPGSLTYEGKPMPSQMHRAPVGSVTFNEVYYRGNRYREVYRVDSNGDLELVNRTLVNN